MAPAGAVLNYHLVSYARTWRGSVLSSFVMPVLFVLGFGLSVGSLVNATGRLGNESYLQFIVPGMIASTAMQVAYGESTWPVMARFQWIRIYDSMVATPLSIRDILTGDMTFLVLRIISTSAVFLFVTALFGAVASWWALLVPLIAAVVGLAFAAPMFALTGRSKTGNNFPTVYRFMIIPMSLFAGVFFKVSSLNVGIRWLAYISPLGTGSSCADRPRVWITARCWPPRGTSPIWRCGSSSASGSPIARSSAGSRIKGAGNGQHRIRAPVLPAL